jgi:hypothetical protein
MVAPALAREVTYDDFDIAEGGEASATFYRVVADLTRHLQACASHPRYIEIMAG